VRLVAAILPLVGLSALWGWSDHASRQGTDWDVPVMGYDPRDFLRGHYVEFRYDWPGVDEGDWRVPLERLCLIGETPVIDRADTLEDDAALKACPHPVRANPGGVYGLESLRQGRLYLGQERARQVDEQLRKGDQRAIIRIRQRADGTITPIGIRFRPLTAEERAVQRAPDGGGFPMQEPLAAADLSNDQ
jgi:hypothetical protein